MDDAAGISAAAPARARRHPGTALEVFRTFLRLGLTSFGGPVAHLGYFREDIVVRRKWLGERAYADLVGLCQFLPGPASSQVGMAIGLQRAGFAGMLVAWAAFTLPSAVLLVAFGYAVVALGDLGSAGWIQGLKAAAVAVVAQAVLGMAKNLTPDARRATIAVGAMIGALLLPTALAQVAVIVAAGLVGLLWLPEAPSAATAPTEDEGSLVIRVPRPLAIACLATFLALLIALPIAAQATGDGTLRLGAIFFRAGALVFGGGHVVLPLLQAQLVPSGLVTHTDFLAGYGAAQAVPGPLFTFSAFLGTVATRSPAGIPGAIVALLAIFLPAALLVVGALPFWAGLRHSPVAQRALRGVNAGVVGLLAAALYTPVFTSGITSVRALAIAVAAFVALTMWKAPPWAVVIVAGAAGLLLL